MKKQVQTKEAAAIAEAYRAMTRATLAAEIAQLDAALGDALKNKKALSKPVRSILIREKKEQIEKIRNLYGEIGFDGGFEAAATGLAKAQGMESVAIADLNSLERTESAEKKISLSIDIAKKIMKQKENPGGRRQ